MGMSIGPKYGSRFVSAKRAMGVFGKHVWCLLLQFRFIPLVVQKSLHSSEQPLEQSNSTQYAYDDISEKLDYFVFACFATFSK